jgi:hypothetical protein
MPGKTLRGIADHTGLKCSSRARNAAHAEGRNFSASARFRARHGAVRHIPGVVGKPEPDTRRALLLERLGREPACRADRRVAVVFVDPDNDAI